MASSSSSSQIIPALVSHSWKHEVFISFRGEDTRKGFVDHLYTALVQQGILTYKDDETLPRGERIGPALVKAIQESRIAVIVFSENYANSSWCLDELAHIVDCMENKGQIVMPVFYDVDPSYVRKQNGKYGEAFTEHECENKHKVKLWREALVKAGNLSGWVSKDFANGHEAVCIKDIVATISSRLSPLLTNVNKNLIGIETRLQHLKSRLNIESGGVRMVGIWGVGGAGKTTLASAAYMETSRQFEACCFLENIRDETNKNGLTKLQEKFLSLITKETKVIGSVVEGQSMIKRKLGCKSVLVVLDDVNEREQLEALAGSHDWFGEGSRIIITTRDEHLLTRKADVIYEVTLLSHDEATNLLRKHAYREDKPVEDYEKLSQDVVSYAGGLPLALEILGSFLYDKDKDEWRSVLAKLKRIPDPDVTKRLKISYDGLQPDEKQLFLDIACFYRRKEINVAMMVLDACNFEPRIGIKVLVQKSLIKVIYGIFEMHDLIEEMAHYIVRGEDPNDLEKHTRIWKLGDMVSLCDMGAAAPETEVLALRAEWAALATFRIAFEKKKKSFWFPKPVYKNHQRLPNVIGNMKKLRWIDWKFYPQTSFPSNFQPTRLGYLILRYSGQKQLWKGCKILPSLKILDLEGSWYLKRTPDFKGLPYLEILNLEDCKSLKEIHPSIGNHKRLVWVNMTGCEKLKWFPPIIDMIKLETLVLSQCSQLKKFPEIQRRMDSLENLHMDRTGIELVPPSVGQFCTNLVYFDLEECLKLKRIEGNFRLLKRLKYLKIFGCIQLEKLAGDFFGGECCLEALPEIFPHNLTKLDLSRCNLGNGDIPSNISEFTRLDSILSKFPCLKFLNLSNCRNLVELPDLPSSIAILIADYCDSLQSVGDLSNCKWLWKVSFRGHNKFIGRKRVVNSMVESNAVEDRFMSMILPEASFITANLFTMRTLQLPHNWYNDFSGFLLSAEDFDLHGCEIYIEQEMLSMYSQPDHHQWEELDKNPESFNECKVVGYVPFTSLRQTSWWNPTYTHITFRTRDFKRPKVGLVRRKSKSRGTPIHYSERWEDTRYKKTFQIIEDPKSSQIVIRWSPYISY